MASSNLERVQKNVGTMIDKGAPDEDIQAYLSSEGVTEDQLRNNRGMFNSVVKPIAKAAAGGVVDFAKNALDTVGNLVYPLSSNDLATKYAESHPDAKVNPFATPSAQGRQAINQAYQGVNDWVGQEPGVVGYTQAGIRNMIGQLPYGGPSLFNASSGLVGGLTGQAAANATGGNEYARWGGQLLGSTLFGLPFLTGNGMTAQMNKGLSNVTDAQLAQAEQLVRSSYAAGSPVTMFEAIQQVTGGNPALGMAQRQAERSPETSGKMGEFMSQRPAKNEAMLNAQLQGLGPDAAEPARLPTRMNQAAESAIDAARKSVNAQTRPLYEKAEDGSVRLTLGSPRRTDSLGQLIPEKASGLDRIVNSNPVVKQVYNEIKGDPLYQKELGKNDPTNGLNALQLIYRRLGEKADNLTSGPTPDYASAMRYGDVKRQLGEFISTTWPAWGKAQQVQADLRYKNVEPLEQGQLGAISKVNPLGDKALKNQMAELLPDAPATVNPQEIKNNIAKLKMQDPAVAQQALKQWIGSKWNEATQDLVNGPNQFGAAKFRAQIAGNSQQAANLQAAVETAAGKDAWRGLNVALKVFEIQGNRMPAGSDTSFNTALQAGTSTSNIRTLATPTRWAQAWDRFIQGRGNERIAELLTNPATAQQVRDLAGMNPQSSKTRALVGALFKIGSDIPAKRGANSNPDNSQE